MSTIVVATTRSAPRRWAKELAHTWWPLLPVLAAAVLTRHLVVANLDVSWLLTLGEKVLAGARPYVDFIEVNPPASIYLYLPGLVIARAIGVAPECVTDGLVFLAIGGSVLFAGRVLSEARLLTRFDGARLAAAVGVILALLPAQTFGEREHIALVLFLPMLAVLAVRANGGAPRAWSLFVGGLGAGAMMVIKPHMALGLGAALAFAAWPTRTPRLLFTPETCIAAAVAAAYGAAVWLLFPEYLSETVPLLRVAYLPVRHDLAYLMWLPAVPIWLTTMLALALFRRGHGADCLYAIPLAASIGFAAAFLVQGKGWPYHSYPMLALALVALAFALAERRTEAPRRIAVLGGGLAVAGLCGAMFWWMNLTTTLGPLVAPIRQIAPHPTMLAITPNLAVGHPLVREVGGTWVGRTGGLWITAAALWRRSHQTLSPEERTQLDRYATLDRALLIETLRDARPDIVIIETAWQPWVRNDRELTELLRSYSAAITTDEVVVLARDRAGAKNPG